MSAAPEFIGKYRVVRPLGQGGMGTLYLAEDTGLDRLIAIKLLKEDSEELRERFLREARTAGRLRHVNIVSVFEFGEFNSQPFIAMEYVPGETLGEIIRRRAPLAVTQKLILMEELCAGLAYAHRAGIVHRDVKPANVMLDADGVIKVLDFGIARLHASGMTRSGVIMGTLNYMSPEQVTGKPIDQRSDIFAVGAVVYEFLAYRQAFPGRLPEVLNKILSQPPDQFAVVAESLDAELVTILERSLAKDPAERYQDLGAMRKDLLRVRLRLEADLDDEQTIVLTRAPQKAGAETDSRSADLAAAVARARSALDAGDLDSARTAIDAVRHLDADSSITSDLQDRLLELVNTRQSEELADEALQLLTQGALTAAYDFARRAEALSPDTPAVVALLGDIDRLRAERDRERARRDAISKDLERAHKAYEDGAFELAVRITADVLAFDPANEAARSLSLRAAEAAERRVQEAAEAAVSDARALFDAGSPEEAIDRLKGFAPTHPNVAEAIRAWTRELRDRNREKIRRQASELTEAGRTAIAREDFAAAEAALAALRQLPVEAAAEAKGFERELQHARDVVAERARIAGVIAQLETVLGNPPFHDIATEERRLAPVQSLWNELPEADRASSRVQRLLEHWQELQAAVVERKRQFGDSLARAASALEDRQLDEADRAIGGALGLQPDDEPALALQRRIGDALAAREAERRADAVRQAIEEATIALSRDDLAMATVSIERARSLDANSSEAQRIAQEIEATARRAAVEREALGIVAEAEKRLNAGDLDGAAGSLAQARAFGTALEAIAAVEARIEAERHRIAARRAADEARRVAELLQAGRTALAAEDFRSAEATVETLRHVQSAAGERPPAETLAIELQQARELVRRREHIAGVIGRIETALEQRRLEVVGPLWNELPDADRDSPRLRPLFERWQQLRAAAELARQFGEAIAKAASALESQRLDEADRAIRDALRLQPSDASAHALQRRIGDAVLAREARVLVAEAEKRLNAADLDGAASALAKARALGTALETIDAVDARIEAERQRIEAARRAADEARRAAELLQAGRAALAAEDFRTAEATVETLRHLQPAADEQPPAETFVLELQHAREVVRERERVVGVIAQIETALNRRAADTAEEEDRRLTAVASFFTELPKADRGSVRVRELFNRLQERQTSFARARQSRESFDKARSAFEAHELGAARAAIAEALRLVPDDQSALALQRQISEAVAARDAGERAAAVRQAIEEATRAAGRGDLETARATIERALTLDADNADARRAAQKIAEDIRQAAAEAEASRRAVTSGLEGARAALADRRFEDARMSLAAVQALDSANKEAAALLKQVSKQQARAEKVARRTTEPSTTVSRTPWHKTSAYLAAAGLVLVLVSAGVYFTRSGRTATTGPVTTGPAPTREQTQPTTTIPPAPVTSPPPETQPPAAVGEKGPPAIALGSVTVDSTPFGRVTMKPLTADITLQKSADTTPFVVDLPVGRYEFTLVAPALPQPYKKIVEVTAAGPNTVLLNHPAFDAGKIVSEILGAPKP